VTEERVTDAYLDSDCAAKISGEEESAKDSCAWSCEDRRTDEREDSDAEGEIRRESKLNLGLDDRRRIEEFDDAVEEQEENDERSDDTSGQELLL
jgi:hypothetical protein